MAYKITPDNDRIKELAKFLVTNHKNEFHNFVVLMESGIACKALQDSIISYLSELSISRSFLPEILPIISQEDKNIVKYFNNILDNNEVELILTKILLDKKLMNNFATSLSLSTQLWDLYKAFIYNDISVEKLEILYSDSLSEQAYKNIDIIREVFSAYDNYKYKLNKIDIASLQKEKLYNEKYYMDKKFVIGFVEPTNKLLEIFIKNIVSMGGIYFPKIYSEDNVSSRLKIHNPIKIAELDNEFDEAYHIANLCQINANSKIVILSENLLFNELLEINLIKYKLDYTNYVYKNKTELFLGLFLEIINFLYNQFDLKKLILILKSPLLINENIYEIEHKVFRKKNHIKNLELVLQTINNLCSEETFFWFKNLSKILQIFEKDSNNSHIEMAKNLAIFLKIDINLYEDYFTFIENFSKYFNFLDQDNYLNYLEWITRNYSIQRKNKSSNLIISRIKDFYLFSDIDLIIIPSFLDDNWPNKSQNNFLLSKFMLEKLGIFDKSDRNLLEILIELVKKNNAYITYPKKFSCESVAKSKYLSFFETIFSKNISELLKYERPIYNIFPLPNIHNGNNFVKETIRFDSSLMPDKISATNLEMLIRNPYGFYVKHVLKLIPIKPIIPEMKSSEFGRFIHLILDKYTKEYDILDNKKLQKLISLSESVYEDISNNYKLPISWLYKFKKIAKGFIEFDEIRRQNLSIIIPEIRGSIQLPIGDKIVTITAIADRIEVNKNNEIYILDYKTGTVPSSKSVNQGISPQLIVEALIAKYKGFSGFDSKNVKKLIYVKISITEPYFIPTEIEINDEILEKHFDGLKKLLNYYYNTKEIKIEKSDIAISSEYNDYKHLTRAKLGYSG
jgi:ATP-dependent helicase/nuclease subunit B